LTTLTPELTTGVELRHDYLHSRTVILRHNLYRNTPAIVGHAHGRVFADSYVNSVATASEGFVHGVVDHFVHQVMEAPVAGGPDVHTRPFSDGLETLQNLYVSRVIGVL
jgi:hypothetical protein